MSILHRFGVGLPVLASASAAWGLLLVVQPLAAQEEPAAAAAPAAGAAATYEGQTPLGESFDWEKRLEQIRAERREALAGTTYDVQFRTMYLDRHKYDDSESEAWAAGGWAGFNTGYFQKRLSLGATAYTSQKILGDEDKDGTLLLKPGQDGYTVVGEIFGDLMLTENLHLYAGRKEYDTPYINRNDTRMTPNTFEAYTLQGGSDIGDGAKLQYGGGWFTRIKERNSDRFVSMSADAGADVDRGVAVGGLNYQLGDVSVGAIDYYSADIINIAYTEAKCAVVLTDELKLKLAAQYSDQQSVGDDLLKGDSFSADQFGLKAELPVGGATFTAAYTDTGSGADMQNPWSGYPGYTSVQVEDFYRAGEEAFLLKAAYSFAAVEGLSAYGLWVNGTDPDADGQYARDEYDLNLQWKAPKGTYEGMMLRARYAVVTQDGGDAEDLDDLRLVCSYDFPW